eukprot:RCo006484
MAVERNGRVLFIKLCRSTIGKGIDIQMSLKRLGFTRMQQTVVMPDLPWVRDVCWQARGIVSVTAEDASSILSTGFSKHSPYPPPYPLLPVQAVIEPKVERNPPVPETPKLGINFVPRNKRIPKSVMWKAKLLRPLHDV